jgi:hypothetical protein
VEEFEEKMLKLFLAQPHLLQPHLLHLRQQLQRHL